MSSDISGIHSHIRKGPYAPPSNGSHLRQQHHFLTTRALAAATAIITGNERRFSPLPFSRSTPPTTRSTPYGIGAPHCPSATVSPPSNCLPSRTIGHRFSGREQGFDGAS